MSVTLSPEALTQLAGRPKNRGERQIRSEPIVGKDILELLSSSMYVDPRAIYREYIQNAADAIDAAFARDLFRDDELGRVDVTLDPAGRTVVIRDDGIGVGEADAERVLTSFGASAKRGTNARGFRGVGRLAAFGYAQTVSFKTKGAGENQSTEVRWDCKKLKAALGNPGYQGDLRQIVRDVVTVTSESEQTEAHYFEVRLERVVRIKNDVLMNPEEVERYLGEVAPAPFHPDFRQADEILSVLKKHVLPCRFRVFVNGSKRCITRPHRTHFAVSQTKSDAVTQLDIRILGQANGTPQAILWIAHHGYQGTLHGAAPIRGLRARIGDMQIGDDQLFYSSFPEARFNAWTIGEVHLLDRRLIPNGRRDGFEQNEAYTDLLSELVPVLREIGVRCRKTSAARARIRGFEMRANRLRSLFEILTRRNLSSRRESRARNEIGLIVAEMKKALRYAALTEQDRVRLRRKLSTLQREYTGLALLRDDSPPFAAFPKAQRVIYEQVIELIHECAPSKAAAQGIVDRLIPRIEAQRVKAHKRRRKQN